MPFDEYWLPFVLKETTPHWRSGWLWFLWHYRMWFAVSGCLWLAGGYAVYLAACWL